MDDLPEENIPGMETERTGENSARAAKSYPVTTDELRKALGRAASKLDRWEMTNDAELVRTTKILRFKDDVEIEVSADGEGSRLTASSASRVGKSDLGQNPKNLEELFAAVDRELGL